MTRLAEREARRWVRNFWATWMRHQDTPGPPWPPEGVDAVWIDETGRIADRIIRRDRRAALKEAR